MNQKRILIVVSLLFSLATIPSNQQLKKSRGVGGEAQPTVLALVRQGASVAPVQAQAPAGDRHLPRTDGTTFYLKGGSKSASVLNRLAAQQASNNAGCYFDTLLDDSDCSLDLDDSDCSLDGESDADDESSFSSEEEQFLGSGSGSGDLTLPGGSHGSPFMSGEELVAYVLAEEAACERRQERLRKAFPMRPCIDIDDHARRFRPSLNEIRSRR